MTNYRLTIIKLAFVFLGSVGTLLFMRWVITPMLPLPTTPPSLLQTFLSLTLGLFAFALIVVAVGSVVSLVITTAKRVGHKTTQD